MQTLTLSFHSPVCCFAAGVVLCEDFEAYLDLLQFDRNANVFMANILCISNLILYGAAVYICHTVNSV